jgi:hypothetical protein
MQTMSIKRFPLLALFLVLIIGGVCVSLALFMPRNASGTPPDPTTMYPQHFPASAPAAPFAITPKSNAVVAFSAQDVQQYMLTHQFPAGAVVPGHTIKILSIKLMTRQQADAQGHELAVYTATKMVYVVTVEGLFYTTYVKAPVGGISSTALYGGEVFDAHTGDMLEWSLPPSP